MSSVPPAKSMRVGARASIRNFTRLLDVDTVDGARMITP